MRIAFRTDASLQAGTGHVMRCLTLADTLKTRGAECHFICREHQGNMIELVRKKGYGIYALPRMSRGGIPLTQKHEELFHASWLGVTQQQDADTCTPILRELQPDWLIVDHYALDARWECAVRPLCRKLMVIDDLADRQHACDLLLDQNLGRKKQDYTNLVPLHCQTLIGPHYALLRPEFVKLRDYSLGRRVNLQPKQLLIAMGGVDQNNATNRVLNTLPICVLPNGFNITVIMGTAAPWLAEVRELATHMPWPTEVLVNIGDMAQRIADSDLAIGAAGGSSWERCCLGLPTLMVVLAENQWQGASALDAHGAASLLGTPEDIARKLPQALSTLLQGAKLSEMSQNAQRIVDGLGATRIVENMTGSN